MRVEHISISEMIAIETSVRDIKDIKRQNAYDGTKVLFDDDVMFIIVWSPLWP